MADSLMVEEAALQAQLECVEENDNEERNEGDTIALGDGEDKNEDAEGEGKKSGKRKLKKRKRAPRGKDSVLYIGHLGNDFLEPELAKFLGQFGKVKALRLSRSKRTGGSKGYAFCQMENQEIANIVADTLSGYILFGKRRLVCHAVPPEKVHDRLFYKFVYKPLAPPKQTKSKSKIKAVTHKLVARERRKRKALKELGIDYDFPGFESALADDKTPAPKDEDKKDVESRPKKARKISDLDLTNHSRQEDDKEAEDVESPAKATANETREEKKESTKSKDAKKLKQSKKKKKKKKSGRSLSL
eukprot:CAMPEP_0168738616 /NCGR_PEP_ID=MMETSP0724-20121128/11027_1 /TAXON_ID=265536 /ORGANISM="Amphiprora sp., Strain CCMP467" /LENGTH=301 /DNA_ID=CAMNT_0008785969 /DNA_START=37 /DNA_END=942 /DNA_ORIENTATION=-